MARTPGDFALDLDIIADQIRSECRHDNGEPANDDNGNAIGCEACDDAAHHVEQAVTRLRDLERT